VQGFNWLAVVDSDNGFGHCNSLLHVALSSLFNPSFIAHKDTPLLRDHHTYEDLDPMSVSFVLVGSQTKRFKTVVKSLAGIGAFPWAGLPFSTSSIQTELLLW
jgi:hypothetical protein